MLQLFLWRVREARGNMLAMGLLSGGNLGRDGEFREAIPGHCQEFRRPFDHLQTSTTEQLKMIHVPENTAFSISQTYKKLTPRLCSSPLAEIAVH